MEIPEITQRILEHQRWNRQQREEFRRLFRNCLEGFLSAGGETARD